MRLQSEPVKHGDEQIVPNPKGSRTVRRILVAKVTIVPCHAKPLRGGFSATSAE
jgi:hypothetical protein